MTTWFPRRGSLRTVVLVVSLLAAVALSRCESPHDGASMDPRFERGRQLNARVTHVVDGDTIAVELPSGQSEDVRYIGIDTPETVKPDTPVQCGGPEAHDANESLVGGREVLLRFDAEARDRYDRLLAYVYVPGAGPPPGLFVNAELVRRGLARTLEIAPNDSLAGLFSRLAEEAGRTGRGLWGSCGW
jgi:micrococcal nuclease